MRLAPSRWVGSAVSDYGMQVSPPKSRHVRRRDGNAALQSKKSVKRRLRRIGRRGVHYWPGEPTSALIF